MGLRQLAIDVALRYIGQPYRWGGDDPIAGFDCSGLVVEALQSVGVLPRKGDWSAHSLLNEAFKRKARYTRAGELMAGMLVFWPNADTGRMRHVEMVAYVMDGQIITVGASGGGSATTTLEAAIKSNAFVKLRPVNAGWVVAIDPF